MSEKFEPKPEITKSLENAKQWAGKEFYVVDREGKIVKNKFGEFTGGNRLEVLRWYDENKFNNTSAGYYHISEFRIVGESDEFLDETKAKEIAERRKENIEKILKPLVGKTLYALYSDGRVEKHKVESNLSTVDEDDFNTGETLYIDPEGDEVRIIRYVSIPDESGSEDNNTYDYYGLDRWDNSVFYTLNENDNVVSGSFQTFYTFDEEKLNQELGKIKANRRS